MPFPLLYNLKVAYWPSRRSQAVDHFRGLSGVRRFPTEHRPSYNRIAPIDLDVLEDKDVLGWPHELVSPIDGAWCLLKADRTGPATVFQSTKLPLTTWFLDIYLLSQTKSGISALELGRKLGVNDNTAWLLEHKLMQAMREREQHGKRIRLRLRYTVSFGLDSLDAGSGGLGLAGVGWEEAEQGRSSDSMR